jgi:hypothetical protein
MITQLMLIILAPFLFLPKYSVAIDKLIFYVLLLLITCFASLNVFNNDIEGYQLIFENPYAYAEIGYIALIEVLKYFGAQSHRSILIFYAILLAALFIYTQRIYKDVKLFPFVYILFLLPLDITQVRFGISSALVVLAFLLDGSKKNGSVIFTLCLAASIHYFSLVIFLIYLISLRVGKNLWFFASLGFFINLALIKYFPLLADRFGLNFRTLHNYQTDEFKLSSLVIWGGAVLFNIFILSKFKKGVNFINQRDNILFSRIFNFSVASLIMLPGLIYMFEFNRLYRFVLFALIIPAIVLHNNSRKMHFFIPVIALNFLLGIYYSVELDYDKILWSFL